MAPRESDPLRPQFEQQGYVVLTGFLEAEVLEAARSELAALVDQHARRLLGEGKIADALEHEPFETRLARLYEDRLDEAPKLFRRELHRAGLFPVFFHPRLLDIVEAFLGPRSASIRTTQRGRSFPNGKAPACSGIRTAATPRGRSRRCGC